MQLNCTKMLTLRSASFASTASTSRRQTLGLNQIAAIRRRVTSLPASDFTCVDHGRNRVRNSMLRAVIAV